VPETPVPPAALTGAVPPGSVLAGRYALIRLIARGGMADVWEAKDTLLERQVAVKILHPHLAADEAFVARFRTEAIAAARLHHRSIVAIFDTCSDNGVEAIVMELARGHTLREEIDRHGHLDPVVVINIGVDVADALQSAHAAGLIHRDVKPANILLCDDQRVMVTDFGIAKVRDNSDRTQTGTMLGSVKYVSPEQVEGNPVDPRSDNYSLGVVLYEALTGQPPFTADTPAATALARLHTVPRHPCQIRRDAPAPLADLIMKAMSLDPAQRHSTAAELRAALLAIRLDARNNAGAGPAGTGNVDATEAMSRPVTGSAGTVVSSRSAAPPPPRPALDHQPPPPPPGSSGSGARWGSVAVAAALIVFALIVAYVLITQANNIGGANNGGNGTDTTVAGETSVPPGGGDAGAAPMKVQAIASFDPPPGDGSEGDNKLSQATDGNPDTRWISEYYPDASMGRKPGIGLVLKLDKPGKVSRLVVTSPNSGWSASVYVADSRASVIDGWGEARAESEDNSPGDTTFEVNAEGQYVLLYLTRLGTGPPAPSQPPNLQYTAQIGEVKAIAG
jgi:serine/threonine-protein kinase